jgi:peptidoglycan/LPS O-acetylase OafA/YrhL
MTILAEELESPKQPIRHSGFHLSYSRSLDGVRGMSIILVLLNHGALIGDGFGFIAVNTFFVLSGFLITSLLIAEWDKFGDISLRHFYLRRALRLLPALIAMLLAFTVYVLLTDPHKRAIRELHEALRALFYFTNWGRIFRIGRNLSLAHAWSLSIEEQFYLIWPVLLLLFLRKTSRNSLLCWILLGIFLALLVRVGIYYTGREEIGGRFVPGHPDRLLMGLDTRADSLLAGCFAGVLVSSSLLPKGVWFQKLLKVTAIASAIALLGAGWFSSTAPWMIYIGWSLSSAFAMILVTHLVSAPRSLLHGLLENPMLVYVGQISYGLYIWHFPIVKALERHHLPWQHLIYLVPVFAVVQLSYYVVEKPCLELKKRFVRST